MRSEARTEPPPLSTRTTSALMPLSRTPSSISLAIVSPPAVPGPARPSTIMPAIVTTPIGPLGLTVDDIGDIGAELHLPECQAVIARAAAERRKPLLERAPVADPVDQTAGQRRLGHVASGRRNRAVHVAEEQVDIRLGPGLLDLLPPGFQPAWSSAM